MSGYRGFSIVRSRFGPRPGFALCLTGLFLAFLAVTAPHRVHHLSERLQALVTHQGVPSSTPHNEPTKHDHSGPASAQPSCQFLFAGQSSPGCIAETSSPEKLPEARVNFPTQYPSPADFIVPNSFPIRAPPLTA